MSEAPKSDSPLPPPPPDAKKPPCRKAKFHVPRMSWNLNGLWVLLPLAVVAFRWYTHNSSMPAKPPGQTQSATRSATAHTPGVGREDRQRNQNKTSSRPDEGAPSTYNYEHLLEGDGRSPAASEDRRLYDYDGLLKGDSIGTKSSSVDFAGPGQLKLIWSEATRELVPLVNQLTSEERTALGIAAVASGFDIYGARVTLTNVGTASIHVTPAKLRIHFGEESASVFVADDPPFLKSTVLGPGQAASGLVMFEARMDIGAAIRLGEGEMSYAEAALEVVH